MSHGDIVYPDCSGSTHDMTARESFLTRSGSGEPPAEMLRPPASIEPPTSLADRTPIAAVMTRTVTCVRAHLSVEELIEMFLERGISGAPVLDAAGMPIGIISKTDVLRERWRADEQDERADEPAPLRVRSLGYEYDLPPGFHAERIAGTTVGEVMTPVVFSLPESASLSQAAALMAVEGVHRIPVLSDGGAVVGVLSALDVMRWLAEQDGYLLDGEHA